MNGTGSVIAYSVILANWNGEAWIERALSSVQLAVRAAGLPAEILVVDDKSKDASPSMVLRRFPGVLLLRNTRNLGYARTVNRGVRAARGPLVVLLNNDLVVREDFILRLLAPFVAEEDKASAAVAPSADPGEERRRTSPGSADSERLFAVTARTLSWDGGGANHLCMGAQFIDGRIQPAWDDPTGRSRCLFAQGGSMACRRDLFLALGGFDPIFAPGYWEDYDLCWQVARAGYLILYEPSAVAFHVGGGSMMRRFGPKEVYLLRVRNHFLFEWLNMTDRGLLARHASWLPKHIFDEWLRGEGFGLTKGFARAFRRLPRVLRGRAERRRRIVAIAVNSPLPDAALFALARGFHRAPSP